MWERSPPCPARIRSGGVSARCPGRGDGDTPSLAAATPPPAPGRSSPARPPAPLPEVTRAAPPAPRLPGDSGWRPPPARPGPPLTGQLVHEGLRHQRHGAAALRRASGPRRAEGTGRNWGRAAGPTASGACSAPGPPPDRPGRGTGRGPRPSPLPRRPRGAAGRRGGRGEGSAGPGGRRERGGSASGCLWTAEPVGSAGTAEQPGRTCVGCSGGWGPSRPHGIPCGAPRIAIKLKYKPFRMWKCTKSDSLQSVTWVPVLRGTEKPRCSGLRRCSRP